MRNVSIPTARRHEPVPRLSAEVPAERTVSLTVETVLVTVGVVAFVGLLSTNRTHPLQWFVVPAMLIIAAMVPAWIANRDFPRFGLDPKHIGLALGTVGRMCICVLPMVFLGLWAIRSLDLPIPLQPTIAGRRNALTWLVYQFVYVAVAEEVFFRGYVQANALRLLGGLSRLSWTARQRIAILISAACFAAAHVVVQGHILSALTFLPGLLLAWLFVRTQSLLAPILFHGLANVFYGIIAMTLA